MAVQGLAKRDAALLSLVEFRDHWTSHPATPEAILTAILCPDLPASPPILNLPSGNLARLWAPLRLMREENVVDLL
jgi:hypothetical protein